MHKFHADEIRYPLRTPVWKIDDDVVRVAINRAVTHVPIAL